MEASGNDYGELPSVLTGNSAIFISVANGPGKIIKDFRKKSAKPLLKGAYINAEIYIGDDQLDALATIKSREELIRELIGLLQHQHRVISALQNQFAEVEATEAETEA
jgi:large subunit ribosomal protein L10